MVELKMMLKAADRANRQGEKKRFGNLNYPRLCSTNSSMLGGQRTVLAPPQE
jgi:hypothetical protein